MVPGALACGVDVDLEALRFGKRLDAHIKFVCARGEELPFGTETFDLVISRVALPCMNVPEVLSQMARVLRRGGTAWFVLHTVSFPMRELLQSIRKRRPEAVVRCLYVIANGVLLHALGVLAPFPFRRHRYGSFQTSRGIARALRCSGLELAAVQRDRFFAITARKGKG